MSRLDAIEGGSDTESFGTGWSVTSSRAASTRPEAFSLRAAFSQCRSTVEGLIPSCRAICLEFRCA